MIDINPAVLFVVGEEVWIIHHGVSKCYSVNELIHFARQQYDTQATSLNEALDALCATGSYVRQNSPGLDAQDRASLAANGFTYVTDPNVHTPAELIEVIRKAQLAATPVTTVSATNAAAVSMASYDGYIPTPGFTPFTKPAMVMEKVTPDEYLGILRARLNKHYMPSADGNVQYNSKPSYCHGVDQWVNDPKHPWYVDGTGCYVDEAVPYRTQEERTIWAYVRHDGSGLETLCQLKRDMLWVRLLDRDNPKPWSLFNQPVAFDRLSMLDEIYL